ncbi:hypothetical protein [Sinorhizobium psoraleae]|uniref:hypothetical protein n=1 Tax=Sinorhizobium psoraleae TaxID=520838 RepID=UPI001FE8EF79|nr:hypothetical protein [Sinorhizobium psoraleae]
MRQPSDNGPAERRTAAANAKRRLLAKFAVPDVQERPAGRDCMRGRRTEGEALTNAEYERLLAELKPSEIAITQHAKLAKPDTLNHSP